MSRETPLNAQIDTMKHQSAENLPSDDLFVKKSTAITPELARKVQEMLDTTYHKDLPQFWNLPYTEEMYIPVRDGKIRILHVNPPNKISKRPLLIISGWGGIPSGYEDTYDALHDNIEFYWIETREKHTSQIQRRGSKFTMRQKAEDVGNVIEVLKSNHDDFVLIGICWGGAIILQGLMDGTLKAPTIVTFDPMNKHWYSRFFLTYIAPLMPVFLVRLLKPIMKWQKVRTIKEEKLVKRASDLVDCAEIWKWKRAALHTKDFHLIGNLHKVHEEVIVVNGTDDTIHKKDTYPKIARELPKGRFIYLETDERQREQLFGLVAREFAKNSSENGIPSTFVEFEKEIKR